MKTKTATLLGFGFASIFVIAGITWPLYKRFLTLPARYYAKEICTCVFVLGRDEEFCKKEVEEFIPMGSIEVDLSQRQVTSKKYGHVAVASEFDIKRGCRIVPNP